MIIVPPSESKRPPPGHGDPFVLDELSFPELNPMRERILDALVTTSAGPDAFERLRVGPALVDEVLRNMDVQISPTRRAIEVYSGPFYEGLDARSLSKEASDRSGTKVVIASSLWGALRPDDQIPSYRLHVCSRLIGLDRLEPMWRTVLPTVLAHATGSDGIVVDLRSPVYQAIGKPTGMATRTVVLRVLPAETARHIGNVDAKRVRGQVARYLLEADEDPSGPEEMAGLVADAWPARLEPPKAGGFWTLLVRPRD